MALTQQQALDLAISDLARRENTPPEQIQAARIEEADFPNGALGAPIEGEMATLMITPGWRILLRTDEGDFEYRATKRQLRLFRYRNQNFKVFP